MSCLRCCELPYDWISSVVVKESTGSEAHNDKNLYQEVG